MNYLLKKRYAIRMGNNFRGYARTVSGNPVTLADCMNDYPVSISVNGNTVQDGTPTPEAPVEMYSCGDRTANLFDVSNRNTMFGGTVDENDWITRDYTNNSTSIAYITCFFNKSSMIQPSTDYKLIVEVKEISNCSIEVNSTYTSASQFKTFISCTSVGIIVPTITTVDDFSTSTLMLRTQLAVPAGSTATAKFRISVLPYDETITADNFVYEPFGYKVPVKVSGKNLFDANDKYTTTYTVDDDGWITGEYDNTEGTSVHYLLMCAKPSQVLKTNTTYKLVTEIKELSGTVYGLNVCGINSSTPSDPCPPQFGDSVTYSESVGLGVFTRNITTLEVFSNSKVMLRSQIAIGTGSIGKVTFRISVLEDTTVTPEIFTYEPYHEPQSFNIYTKEPINGNTSVADVITVDVDSKTCTDIRNYAEIVFDGSESGWKKGSSNDYGICNYTIPIDCQNTRVSKSTHFKMQDLVIADAATVGFITSIKAMMFRMIEADYPTVEDFKAWLTAQAEAGTPLTVIYQLAEPTTTDISALQNWNSIPKLNRGTNIITAETETEPSAIEVNYYADKTGA